MSAALREELLSLLSCPDDGATLRRQEETALRCTACARQFPVTAGGKQVSLLSSHAADLGTEGASQSYVDSYRRARSARAGGENWRVDPGGKRQARKQWQVSQVEQLLSGGGPRDIVCDFSAGPGYYTLEYAPRWRGVIHCDLSQHSLHTARQTADARGLDNILFVRMDYLNPCFRASLPRVICLDSLIRGPRHEQALLAAIRSALAPRGAAVVDFHNWWHNPLRRLGMLRQNFGDNRSYAARELAPLLASAGITQYERVAFHQELADAGGTLWRWLAERALPPTRWMFRFTHGS